MRFICFFQSHVRFINRRAHRFFLAAHSVDTNDDGTRQLGKPIPPFLIVGEANSPATGHLSVGAMRLEGLDPYDSLAVVLCAAITHEGRCPPPHPPPSPPPVSYTRVAHFLSLYCLAVRKRGHFAIWISQNESYNVGIEQLIDVVHDAAAAVQAFRESKMDEIGPRLLSVWKWTSAVVNDNFDDPTTVTPSDSLKFDELGVCVRACALWRPVALSIITYRLSLLPAAGRRLMGIFFGQGSRCRLFDLVDAEHGKEFICESGKCVSLLSIHTPFDFCVTASRRARQLVRHQEASEGDYPLFEASFSDSRVVLARYSAPIPRLAFLLSVSLTPLFHAQRQRTQALCRRAEEVRSVRRGSRRQG